MTIDEVFANAAQDPVFRAQKSAEAALHVKLVRRWGFIFAGIGVVIAAVELTEGLRPSPTFLLTVLIGLAFYAQERTKLAALRAMAESDRRCPPAVGVIAESNS